MHMYLNDKKPNLLEHCNPQGKVLKELSLESLAAYPGNTEKLFKCLR